MKRTSLFVRLLSSVVSMFAVAAAPTPSLCAVIVDQEYVAPPGSYTIMPPVLVEPPARYGYAQLFSPQTVRSRLESIQMQVAKPQGLDLEPLTLRLFRQDPNPRSVFGFFLIGDVTLDDSEVPFAPSDGDPFPFTTFSLDRFDLSVNRNELLQFMVYTLSRDYVGAVFRSGKGGLCRIIGVTSPVCFSDATYGPGDTLGFRVLADDLVPIPEPSTTATMLAGLRIGISNDFSRKPTLNSPCLEQATVRRQAHAPPFAVTIQARLRPGSPFTRRDLAPSRDHGPSTPVGSVAEPSSCSPLRLRSRATTPAPLRVAAPTGAGPGA
jgi:hypothetical protein